MALLILTEEETPFTNGLELTCFLAPGWLRQGVTVRGGEQESEDRQAGRQSPHPASPMPAAFRCIQ